MSASFTQQSNLLLNTTVFPQDYNELLIKLTSNYTDISNYLNLREIAIYDTTEIVTGEQWNNPGQPTNRRPGFRQVYLFGAISAGANLAITTNISTVTSFTHIYGTVVTSVPDYRPFPFADVTAVTNQISVKVTSTTATIFNGATAPNITSGILVLEYLKS